MLALRSFKNQKEADLAELRNHNAQLLSALEAVPGGSAAAAAAALPLTLMQQQQRIQVRGGGSLPDQGWDGSMADLDGVVDLWLGWRIYGGSR